jgi:hypothetical protein
MIRNSPSPDEGEVSVTSPQAKLVFAVAVVAGGAAGVLGALGVACALRFLPTAIVSAGGTKVSAPTAVVDPRVPRSDAVRFHERLEAHGREAIDPSWALEARRAYEGDLRGLAADNGFTLESVDCRTTSCVADVSFASLAAAKDSMKKIVVSRWTLNCTKAMSLDEANESSPYSTSIYFDCANTRTSTSTAMD